MPPVASAATDDVVLATPAPDPWVARGLLLVLGVGVLLRVFYALELPSYPAFHQPEVDAWHYHVLAQRIAAGDLLLDGEPSRMSPGYTYFLAGVYALFGAGPWPIRLVQMLLGLVTVWLSWSSARKLVGPRWALLPAAVAASYGPFLYFEGHLLAESLGVFLHALLLHLALTRIAAPRVGIGGWLVLGMAWGACCVVRPNALLLLPAFVVVTYARPRRPGCFAFARNALVIAVGGLLLILPISARTLMATGEPVLLTSHGGINFYIGNGPDAIGTWTIPRDVPDADSSSGQFDAFHVVAERATGRALNQKDADAYWYGRTRAAVLADPARFARVILRKLHLFWNGRELHNIYDYEFWRDIGVLLGAPLPQFSWLAPFGLVGALWLLWRSPAERFVACFVWLSSAAVVLVFVTDRYRVPSVPGILLLGVVVVRALAQAVAARRTPALLGLVAALALGVAIAWPVAVNKRFHEKYSKLGGSWLQLGHLGRAHWAYEHAVDARADFVPAVIGLAQVYERAGDPQAALSQWQRAQALAQAQGDHSTAARAHSRIDALKRP